MKRNLHSSWTIVIIITELTPTVVYSRVGDNNKTAAVVVVGFSGHCLGEWG